MTGDAVLREDRPDVPVELHSSSFPRRILRSSLDSAGDQQRRWIGAHHKAQLPRDSEPNPGKQISQHITQRRNESTRFKSSLYTIYIRHTGLGCNVAHAIAIGNRFNAAEFRWKNQHAARVERIAARYATSRRPSSGGSDIGNPGPQSVCDASSRRAFDDHSTDSPRLRVPADLSLKMWPANLPFAFRCSATFADDGRLFVAESSGGDLHAELKAGARNSRIRVLEDANGDGHFETARVFADKLVFPMGLAWRDGKLYVADPPDVVVYADNDADGRADRRRVILTGFGQQTNGSLHGLVFGPDGMLYMTMGSPDGYSLKARDGTLLEGDERRADPLPPGRLRPRSALPRVRQPRRGRVHTARRHHRHRQLVSRTQRRNARCARAPG